MSYQILKNNVKGYSRGKMKIALKSKSQVTLIRVTIPDRLAIIEIFEKIWCLPHITEAIATVSQPPENRHFIT